MARYSLIYMVGWIKEYYQRLNCTHRVHWSMESEIRNMSKVNQKLSTNSKSNGSMISPHFQDEDFIVFGFTQDGALDIVQQSPSPSTTKGEKTKSVDDASGRSYLVQEMESPPTFSVDSNHSESSKPSFSFPVLQWEVMGSPVQMPKSQDRDARKHKVLCARFHCCRF